MADQTYKIKPLTLAEIDVGIENLSARILEVDELDKLKDFKGDPEYLVAQSIRVAVLDIFGQESIEFHDYGQYQIWDESGLRDIDGDRRMNLSVKQGIPKARRVVQNLIKRLEERKKNIAKQPAAQTLVAFENLTLHARIEAAAAGQYKSGHYKNAVLDAAIALQNAVKEKSRRHDLDGTALMQQVFSANAPILAFTVCGTVDEKNEQLGWMQLYAGAIQAVRNPRGHNLDPDTPETALELLVFLSFLTKSLEQTTLRP